MMQQHIISYLALAVLSASLTGCTQQKKEILKNQESYIVSRTNILDCCSVEGILRPFRSFVFAADKRFKDISAVYVTEGDSLQKGSPILDYDSAKLDDKIKLNISRIKATELKIKYLQEKRDGQEKIQAEKELIVAQNKIESTERELHIQEQLAKEGIGTETDLEKARIEKQLAEMDLKLIQKHLVQLQDDSASPEIAEQISVLENLRLSQHELDEEKTASVLTAPFDGRVLGLHNSLHDFAQDSTDNIVALPVDRLPLLVFGETSQIKVKVNIYEKHVAKVCVGQTALVTATHVPDIVFTGQVIKV
ncbi:hypothetical protein H8D64_02295, partial [PVC group bacterium]|nr:hypothetical protein [PVC group bacterium]